MRRPSGGKEFESVDGSGLVAGFPRWPSFNARNITGLQTCGSALPVAA